MDKNDLIIVRGAGDIATGTIHRLKNAGFRALVLETDKPSAIRRKVAFSEAVYDGRTNVEGVDAVLADSLHSAENILSEGKVPVLVDPYGGSISVVRPKAVVDAVLAKRNLGTNRNMAPLTIALGPGFEAGTDVDYVVETQRGHDLGRVLSSGYAKENTGVPGVINGYGAERVIHAEQNGILKLLHDIGDFVRQDEAIAEITNENGVFAVRASLTGLLRGIIRDGYEVDKGLKIADIDPRKEEYDNCFTISDKARCIAGSVLEIIVAN